MDLDDLFGNQDDAAAERPIGGVGEDEEPPAAKKAARQTAKNNMANQWVDPATGEMINHQKDFYDGCGPQCYRTPVPNTLKDAAESHTGMQFGYNFTSGSISGCDLCGGKHKGFQAFSYDLNAVYVLRSKCHKKDCLGYHHVSDVEHYSNAPGGPFILPFEHMPVGGIAKIPYYCFEERKKGDEEWCNQCNAAPVPDAIFSHWVPSANDIKLGKTKHSGEFLWKCRGSYNSNPKLNPHPERVVWRKRSEIKEEGQRGPMR